jgi:hypothetical protein
MFGGHRETLKSANPIQNTYNVYRLNDLWRYNVPLQKWQLIQADTATLQSDAGPSGYSFYGSPGTYGTKGEASASNRPGSREGATAWTDSNGNFWMFGGEGLGKTLYPGNSSVGLLSDLWKYVPATGKWTWVNGLDGLYQEGVFSDPGALSYWNSPASRKSSVGWAFDKRLYMYGGRTWNESRNAIWVYDINSNTWAWTSNSATPIVFSTYGIKNVASAANFPGFRLNAMTWTDTDGSLWLYGGEGFAQWGYGNLDDMWKLNLEDISIGGPGGPVVPGDLPELNGTWASATETCKTNKKGQTKCQLKATLLLTNTGTQDAGKSEVNYFLSNDNILDGADLQLKGKNVGKLKSGAAKTLKIKLKLTEPATGKYLIAIIDSGQAVTEQNETNNIVISDPLP